MKINIEVSARHIHLTQEDIKTLFGKNELTSIKKLSQCNDFAAEETVNVEINGKLLKGVRVVGEARDYTQLEITITDAYFLKADIPVKLSGDIKNTPGMKIIGSSGEVIKNEGVIIAKRHLHVSPQEAKKLKIKEGDEISVKCGSARSVIFNKVMVRVKKDFKSNLHIDTDEANAAGIKGGEGEIV